MVLTVFQEIILGISQGIFEWLPISSSAFIVFIMSNIFHTTDLTFILKNTLFLHLGTFFAALIYFRKDVSKLFVSLFHYKKLDKNSSNKKTLNFIIISTIISGIIGFVILKFIENSQNNFDITGKTITLVIAFFLLITAIVQLKIKSSGAKTPINLRNSDSIILGFAQGIAVLPGLSRSGMTVSSLLLRKFDDTTSLRLSFLMSLPIVLAGNIILNVKEFVLTSTAIYGLIFSFIFGILTIHGLMKLSKKINFGWFVLIFSVLMGLSVLI